MKKLAAILIICLGVFNSCVYFTAEPEENVVARVNEHYLYVSDLKNLISENTSPEDSLQIVTSYINRWATRHLLMDRALVNLSPEELERYEHLVREYRSDLLTEAYKNAVVSKQLDSTVTEGQFLEYYEGNKENYRLNEVLLKVRYIQLSPNYQGVAKIKERLNRFDEDDKSALTDASYSFISSNLNDSSWIRKENLQKILPILKRESQVLNKSNFIHLEDSLGVYLVKTVDMVGINEPAPLSYVEPTIKQVILNRRKLRLISKFETDIAKDAIEHNNFQIYTHE